MNAGAAVYWPRTARIMSHETGYMCRGKCVRKTERLFIYETDLVKVKPTINKMHNISKLQQKIVKTLMEAEQFKL